MSKQKVVKQDKIDELQNELEMLKDELDSNDLEQATLRGLARGLHEDIERIEHELENLGVRY
jgi:chromosome segregation ATPase